MQRVKRFLRSIWKDLKAPLWLAALIMLLLFIMANTILILYVSLLGIATFLADLQKTTVTNGIINVSGVILLSIILFSILMCYLIKKWKQTKGK